MADVVAPTSVLLAGHDVPLGRYTVVRRLLPQRARRLIGAWCFVDQFGPDEVAAGRGMRVPPHPHTGLQTVSWLVEGEILHRDSLGSHQTIRPGQLNLMTSGRGIAHSEESPPQAPPVMHGLQLWVALPESSRHGPPRFEHLPDVPGGDLDGVGVRVVLGEVGGARSPATACTPLLGAELTLSPGAALRLPLAPDFEHGVLALNGTADVDGAQVSPGSLLYLDRGRRGLDLRSAAGARLFLLGGEPFDEPLVMWWNFVGRSHEEIVAAREDWMSGDRFGVVSADAGDPLPAPELPTVRLKARDRHGATTI